MSYLQYCKIASKRWHPYLAPIFNNNASVREKSTADIKWLWKANEEIQEFHKANIAGTRIGSCVATLNSAMVLEPRHFIQTFEHLQRKTPHLRTCLRDHGDSLWFCQPPNLEVDFQVLEEGTAIREEFWRVAQKFNSPDAASWFARLIPHPREALCPIPEVKISHPYQYCFMCGGPHGLMDGAGASFIMKYTMEILNDVAAEKPIDEGEYNPIYEDQEIPALLNKIKEKFNQDPDFTENFTKTRLPPAHVPLFFQAFPRPNLSEPSTNHITGILEPHTLKDFQLKCRKEGVTFNSALVAVINTAVMELIRQEGIMQDTYKIGANIMTSFRRYMKPSRNFYYGPCAASFTYILPVDKNIRKNFWGYCRKVNDELQCYLKEGFPLQQKALQDLKDVNQPPIDYVTAFRPAIHDYSLTNFGDLTSLISNDEKIVKVTSLTTMNIIQNSLHSSFHQVLSFHGQYYHTISYATNYFSDETAKFVLDKIFSIIEDLSQNDVSGK